MLRPSYEDISTDKFAVKYTLPGVNAQIRVRSSNGIKSSLELCN